MKKIDVIILAGGYGKRIRRFTKNKIPKPLLKIKNRPFLDYLLQNISKFPINKIYIITGHKGELINKRYNNKFINKIKIKCIKEKISKGTGYALFLIKKKIKNDFILMNGDTIVNFNLNNFFRKKLNKRFLGYMVLCKSHANSLSDKLSNLKLNKDKSVNFANKINLINTGLIFFKRRIIFLFNKKKISLEKDILSILIKQKKLKGIITYNFFIDIGTAKNYILSKKILPKYYCKPSDF